MITHRQSTNDRHCTRDKDFRGAGGWCYKTGSASIKILKDWQHTQERNHGKALTNEGIETFFEEKAANDDGLPKTLEDQLKAERQNIQDYINLCEDKGMNEYWEFDEEDEEGYELQVGDKGYNYFATTDEDDTEWVDLPTEATPSLEMYDGTYSDDEPVNCNQGFKSWNVLNAQGFQTTRIANRIRGTHCTPDYIQL